MPTCKDCKFWVKRILQITETLEQANYILAKNPADILDTGKTVAVCENGEVEDADIVRDAALDWLFNIASPYRPLLFAGGDLAAGEDDVCPFYSQRLVETITMQAFDVTVGNSVQYNLVVLPANAVDKTVTWTSSNLAVATVSPAGVVSGVMVGVATITATANDGSGVFDDFIVTVS
jgi:hypothetical protein